MTPEEIKAEMLKVKVPWFVKAAEWIWFKFGSYAIFFGILSFIPVGLVYEKTNWFNPDKMWTAMIIWFFILFAVFGGLMLVSHLIEGNFVKKQAKRLGISVPQWNAYAKELDLRSYKG